MLQIKPSHAPVVLPNLCVYHQCGIGFNTTTTGSTKQVTAMEEARRDLTELGIGTVSTLKYANGYFILLPGPRSLARPPNL